MGGQESLNQAMQREDDGRTKVVSLYIGVPYCPSVCTYCDFNVYARRESEFDAYAQALTCEVKTVAESIAAPRAAKSLAFGGGTPSVLGIDALERIVRAARDWFRFEPGAEWTLEANPGTVDLDKLRALRALGLNRLSLGVQTFDDWRLQQFNRRHTVADSYQAFEWARRAGFANLNLDLIFGLPNQTLAEWRATLERALEMAPEHLSLYGLQVEPRTVLQKQIQLGRVPMPDADTAAEMYELAVQVLGEAGFVHYEISNWARPGFESRHNQTYWLNEPYLGLGAGAHSSWAGERYENIKSPRVYIERAGQGQSPIASREAVSPAMQMSETVFLGLRLSAGVRWERFSARFGVDARELYSEPIELLSSWNMLEADAEGMRLTERGRLVSNQLLWRFLPEDDE